MFSYPAATGMLFYRQLPKLLLNLPRAKFALKWFFKKFNSLDMWQFEIKPGVQKLTAQRLVILT
jgi:hypothetical protein